MNRFLSILLFSLCVPSASAQITRAIVQFSAWNIAWGDYADALNYQYDRRDISAEHYNALQFGPLPCLSFELSTPLRQSALHGSLAFWFTGGSARYAPNSVFSVENSLLALGVSAGFSYPLPVRRVIFLPGINLQLAFADWVSERRTATAGERGEYSSPAWGIGLGSKVLFPLTDRLEAGVHLDLVFLPAQRYSGRVRTLTGGNWTPWRDNTTLVSNDTGSYLGPERGNSLDHHAKIGLSGGKIGMVLAYAL